MNILCLDIGGTHTRAALVGNDGLIEKKVEKTPQANSNAILDLSKNLINDLKKKETHKILAISIGCAGPVKDSIMQGSKPMELSVSIDFQKFMGEHFNLPIFVANDLQMAIRAEKTYGQGKGTRNFALVTLSTGIGVAVVMDNKPLDSRIEIGHNIVETDQNIARTCTMGHKGCWVSQASGSAIRTYLSEQRLNISFEEFFKKPDKNILDKLIKANTNGLTQIIHAYDPEKIIIMGSLGIKQFHQIIPSYIDIENYCLLRPIPPIIKSKLGDEIGLLGAYEFAKERLDVKNA